MNLPELFSRARADVSFLRGGAGEKKNLIPDVMCLQSSPPAPDFLMFSLGFFRLLPLLTLHQAAEAKRLGLRKLGSLIGFAAGCQFRPERAFGGVGSNVRSGAAPTSRVAPRHSG